jgi:hypothetical protein
MSEEIEMYCCLPFSYAVKYGLIKIDYECNLIEIPLKTSLTEIEKKAAIDKLNKENISSHVHPDYLAPAHCPWCGLHLNIAVDFEKGCSKPGQYSSKENWER